MVMTEGLLQPAPPSVWGVFGELATETESINLGQGFPDYDPPDFVVDSLKVCTSHQYTRPAGHPMLVKLLASRYSRHLDREVNANNEIAVTVGASQALYLTLTTLLKEGDEVIIFEPFFELYLKQIKLTGATPKFVQLGGDSATLKDPWALNIELLRQAVTSNTKMLLLNSPHNPTGKVFTHAELQAIAEIVAPFPDLVVVSDEVYKYTVYNPLERGDEFSLGHYHFARLPDMWDRTITISSCGKTFSVTGWQVGWMVGPARFIQPVQDMLPCVQFCTSTPVQEALCKALQQAEEPYLGYSSYYEWLRSQFSSKRAVLELGLAAVGVEALPSQGGYFLMGKLPTDDSLLQQMKMEAQEKSKGGSSTNKYVEPYDWRFCRQLVDQCGVLGIPASPFFQTDNYATQRGQDFASVSGLPPLARFAFCKRDDTLLEAKRRLKTGSAQPISVSFIDAPSLPVGALVDANSTLELNITIPYD